MPEPSNVEAHDQPFVRIKAVTDLSALAEARRQSELDPLRVVFDSQALRRPFRRAAILKNPGLLISFLLPVLQGRGDPAVIDRYVVVITLLLSMDEPIAEETLCWLLEHSEFASTETVLSSLERALEDVPTAMDQPRLVERLVTRQSDSNGHAGALAKRVCAQLGLADIPKAKTPADGAASEVERLPPNSRERKCLETWLRSGRTARQALLRFAELGALKGMPSQRLLRALENHWERETFRPFTEFHFFIRILEELCLLHVLDTESGTVAPPYDQAIEELGSLSGDVFRPFLAEVRRDATGRAESFRFVVGHDRYACAVRDNGDYYDVAALYGCINAALRETGREEQLISLDFEGQCSYALLGKPKVLKGVCVELDLPYGGFWPYRRQ